MDIYIYICTYIYIYIYIYIYVCVYIRTAPGTMAMSTPRCCIVASRRRVCSGGSIGTPDEAEIVRT